MSEGASAPAAAATRVEPGAAARSALYALLARAFTYPEGELAEGFADGTLMHELAAAVAELPYPLEHALEVPPRVEAEPLKLTFTALFDTVGASPRVSMLERRYLTDRPEPALWEDLLRFYGYFGLSFADADPVVGPDHLALELEFMHYLTFLEAGSSASAPDCRRAARDFLARHLGAWSGAFASAVAAAGDAAPYDRLAALLAAFVDAERMELEERAHPA